MTVRRKRMFLWMILILFVGFYFLSVTGFPYVGTLTYTEEYKPVRMRVLNKTDYLWDSVWFLPATSPFPPDYYFRYSVDDIVAILTFWLWIGIPIAGIAFYVWDSRRLRRRAKTARRRGQRKHRDNTRLTHPTIQTIDGVRLPIVDADMGTPETASSEMRR